MPGSYDRKGASHFLKDRLIRLGIPLIIYSWIISPLTWVVITGVTQGQTRPWWTYLPGVGDAVIGAGPLWFVEVLLIFTLVYALWRRLFRLDQPTPPIDTESRFPGNVVIVLFALLTAVGAFLVRLWMPVGESFSLLNLQFPFFVLYIALFIVGLMAYRRNWSVGRGVIASSRADSTGRYGFCAVGVLPVREHVHRPDLSLPSLPESAGPVRWVRSSRPTPTSPTSSTRR